MNPNLAPSPTSGPEKVAVPKPTPEPRPPRHWYSPSTLWQRKTTIIAAFSIAAILAQLSRPAANPTVGVTPHSESAPAGAKLWLASAPIAARLISQTRVSQDAEQRRITSAASAAAEDEIEI